MLGNSRCGLNRLPRVSGSRASCTTGPQLPYQEIGAGNLRPYVQV